MAASERILDFTKVSERLSYNGCGFYVSEGPLVRSDKLKQVSNGLAKIPTEEMQLLFNDVSSEALQNECRNQASSSIGCGPVPIYSSDNGRKYTTLNKRMGVLRQEEVSAYNAVRSRAEKVMSELGTLFQTAYKVGEWSLIRSIGICGEQSAHCDAAPEVVDSGFPDISMLLALDEPGKLNVYRGAHRLVRDGNRDIRKYEESFQQVSIPVGHFVLFRQDLPHCGVASMGFNQRMFFGFIWKGLKGKRKRSTGNTYILLG